MGGLQNRRVGDWLSKCQVGRTKPSHRLVLLPAIDKPGYFGFYLSGVSLDLDALVADEQALRLMLRERVGERKDLVFGKIDTVTAYKYAIATSSQRAF